MSFYSKIALLLCAIGLLAAGCSNTKNTAATRAFHNLTAHYNVIFEAQQSYDKGILAIEDGLKVNYTELLPVWKLDDPQASEIATSYMDACVEECGKNILKHSITSKPNKKYSKTGMSQNDEAFYSKAEYCKWIDDTYLLMGKANYVTRDLDRAESALQLGITRFKHEPSKFEAMFWLAKTFWAQKNYNESKELLTKLRQDKRHPKTLDKDISKLFADLAIKERHYDEAIKHLNDALALIKKRKKNERAWLIFILGDLNRLAGHYPDAKRCYETVIKLNPQYSMVFNAKINLATVFTPGDNVDYIKSQLLALAADDKNAEYKDQIYFALAELDNRNGNKQSALVNYKKSAHYSSQNNVQKAKSYLAIADIYFDKNDYINSGKFYDSTMQYMPTTYSGYGEISAKAKNLTELISFINEAQNQDSLQRVANMPVQERKKFIAKIIDDVIVKEEAEKIAQTNPYYQSNDNNYGVEFTGTDGNPNFSGKWYLYNVTALNYGRQEFLKKWGNRPLEDNWRRKNKTTSAVIPEDEEVEEDKSDSTITNKNPEFYTRNLPLTDSAMKACINKEADAWFAVATIYYDKIGDVDKAVETLLFINQQHPDHYLKAQCYYQLYKLYVSKGEFQMANYVKSQLESEFPESGYSKILNDPKYLEHIANRKNQANQMYENVITEFNNGNYSQALNICQQGQNDFADLEIAENFIYMEARCYGNLQNTEKMKHRLTFLIENYPGSKLIPYAKNKLSALETGNFETMKFKSDTDNEPHYLCICVNTENPKAKEVNFILLDFCANSGLSQADVEQKKISSSKTVYYAYPLQNKITAIDYIQKFTSKNRSQLIPEKDFVIFCISESNFALINEESDIESYTNFYLTRYTN
jgi:tetratricopeptide (TPR) repeat protein